MAQRLGRGITLLFLDRGTRRGLVFSSTPRPHFTPGKDTVPILQEAGWAPVPVWTGGKSRPHRDSIPDRPARSQSLYRLSYRAHTLLRTDNLQRILVHCLALPTVCQAPEWQDNVEKKYLVRSVRFSTTLKSLVDQGLLIFEASRSHLETPHSVGFLWTSDQPI